MKIPLMDIQAQYHSIKTEIDETVHKVLNEAIFVGGKEKELFEQEFSEMFGVKHTLGVGNGTDAIFLVLKALGIGPGDEVVTAANSFIASSEAISATGAHVVFCDIDEKTSLLDIARLEDLLKRRSIKNGGKIKAILPVHLYGRIHDMDAMMNLAEKYGVQIIEDSAQAHLAKWKGKNAGTFGVAGTFSFYPGKNLGAFGDAGAVVTNNTDLALQVKKLADHGRISKYDHDMEGYNSRLDTLQAAVLRVKLKHLQKWTLLRQQKAQYYSEQLNNLPKIICPEIPPEGQHVFHIYCIRSDRRDQLLQTLQNSNIFAGVHYPIALPFLKAYAKYGYTIQDFPVAARLQSQILSLPLYPEITSEMQDQVVRVIKDFATSIH